jgi:pSer/pThr/pTyr-binding forkhead associated (FHA) protein
MNVASKSIEISRVLAGQDDAGRMTDVLVARHDACLSDLERTAFVMALAAEAITARKRLALAQRQHDVAVIGVKR